MRLPKEKRKAIWRLVGIDYLTAVVAWLIFWLYRQQLLGNELKDLIHVKDFAVAFLFIPAGWLFLYLMAGTYFDIYRKSRLNEVNRTLITCIIGCVTVALYAFANDANDYSYFIKMTGRYLLIHTLCTLSARIIVLNLAKRKLKKGKVGYKTLIVGSNEKAESLYQRLTKGTRVHGNIFIGFVSLENNASHMMSQYLPELGSVEKLERIIDKHQIEEVIIAVDTHDHDLLENLLTRLSYRPVVVKLLPDLYDIIAGSVKTSDVYDAVLIHIHPELMPDWQRVCKRFIDIVASLSALIILSPLYLLAAIRVKRSSEGPIIYSQKRIGKYGKPFRIYKFRSMYLYAEKEGPSLSSDNDPRITPWGKIMRKWRIDELPQFVNILRGDMSLVGPRPERKYFIDIITQTHPHYKYLHKVKPGITSWGMVQFGYAENVEEMIERMKYDLLYIENCSLALDIKIMFYTLIVIFQGRGK